MSYDLYFIRPEISCDQLTSYFAGRTNYETSPVQAIYRNDDTGVYFSFDYAGLDESDPETIRSIATFNLNFYRPHYFALEAVHEVSEFVEHFGFSIHDPQNEGMGDGHYSPERFLRGWNCGNEFGYSAILGQSKTPEKVRTLPTSNLESIWQWNYAKHRVQESFSEDRFVPRIFFMMIDGTVATAAVWPDAIAELIPEVDYLYIVRDQLAPKSLFGAKKKDQIIIPFEQAQSVLNPYKTDHFSMPAYLLPAPQALPETSKFVITLKATGIKGEGISADQVLNAEIIEKVNGNSPR